MDSKKKVHSIPLFTSTPYVPTKEDYDRVIERTVGDDGSELVTLANAIGTETVLAGSVFDPTSGNYKPGK